MASVFEAMLSGTIAAVSEVPGFALYEGVPAVKGVSVTELYPIRTNTEGGHVVEFNPSCLPDNMPGALVCVADRSVAPVRSEDPHHYNGHARSEFTVPVVVVIMAAVSTPEDAAIADKARLDCWGLAEAVLVRLMRFQPTVDIPAYASTQPFGAGIMESEPVDATTHIVVLMFNAKYALVS